MPASGHSVMMGLQDVTYCICFVMWTDVALMVMIFRIGTTNVGLVVEEG